MYNAISDYLFFHELANRVRQDYSLYFGLSEKFHGRRFE